MAAEENKEVIRRFFTAMNAGDFNAMLDQWNDNLTWHSTIGVANGKEELVQAAGRLFSGLPGLQATIEEIIGEGDMVAARWSVRGTHSGELMGIPPTGREVVWKGSSIYRLENGKITEEWFHDDTVGLMRQIGAIPEPSNS